MPRATFTGLRAAFWVSGYVVILALIVAALFQARRTAVRQLSTPSSVANWQKWRDDVRRAQDHPGPVQRRVPKSSEPPALVLMRDYFAVSLVGAILFCSTLYWVIAWFVSGALQRS